MKQRTAMNRGKRTNPWFHDSGYHFATVPFLWESWYMHLDQGTFRLDLVLRRFDLGYARVLGTLSICDLRRTAELVHSRSGPGVEPWFSSAGGTA